MLLKTIYWLWLYPSIKYKTSDSCLIGNHNFSVPFKPVTNHWWKINTWDVMTLWLRFGYDLGEDYGFKIKISFQSKGTFVTIVTIINMWLRLGYDCVHAFKNNNDVDCLKVWNGKQTAVSFIKVKLIVEPDVQLNLFPPASSIWFKLIKVNCLLSLTLMDRHRPMHSLCKKAINHIYPKSRTVRI